MSLTYGYTSSRITEIDAPIVIQISYANVDTQLYFRVTPEPLIFDSNVAPSTLLDFKLAPDTIEIIVAPNHFLNFGVEIISPSPFDVTEPVTLTNLSASPAAIIATFDNIVTSTVTDTPTSSDFPDAYGFATAGFTAITPFKSMIGMSKPIDLEFERVGLFDTNIEVFFCVNSVPQWGGAIYKLQYLNNIIANVSPNDFIAIRANFSCCYSGSFMQEEVRIYNVTAGNILLDIVTLNFT